MAAKPIETAYMDTDTGKLLLGGVQVVASLVIGFGGAAMGNKFAKNQAIAQKHEDRRSALVSYEKALMDRAWWIESTLGPGSGIHAKPEDGAMETARTAAYPYLSEFEGHSKEISLLSPYFEDMGGDGRDDEMKFLLDAHEAIQEHLRNYPKPPKKPPYKKG